VPFLRSNSRFNAEAQQAVEPLLDHKHANRDSSIHTRTPTCGDDVDVDIDPPLPTLFNFTRLYTPFTVLDWIIILCYIPVGITLMCFRLCLAGILAIILYMLPQDTRLHPPPTLLRVLFFVLCGMIVRTRNSERLTQSSRPIKSDGTTGVNTNKSVPFIVACNHRSAFDLLPFLALRSVTCLIDHTFFAAVMSSYQKIVGAKPIDQSNKSQSMLRSGIWMGVVLLWRVGESWTQL
jgi:hypothetical protein